MLSGIKFTITNDFKICLIIHSLNYGGMERVMALLANNFIEKTNAEIHLILIGSKREIKYPLYNSVNVYRPNFIFSNKKRNWNAIKTFFYLRKTVKGINPNAILSFGEVWNNFVLLSLFGLKIPVFISDRSQPNKNLGKFHNLLRKWLYPRAHGYIAQTEHAKEICIRNNWNKNISVIGNPIKEIRTNKPIERENIILSVGRLIDSKNFDKLIKLFAEINYSGWKLIIVGGDAKKQNNFYKLNNLVNMLNLPDKVILEGYRQNVEEYYLKSKIFAFTSTSEGFPNVLGEAMAAGCACISFDCIAGPSELIDDGINGFLIPVGDLEQYKQKLKLLMEDEKLRDKFGQAAIEKIKNNFSVDIIAKKYLDFLLSC